MRRLLEWLIGAVVLVLSLSANAAEAPWTLKRDVEGIQVFLRPVAGSPIDAVRSVMTVPESPAAIASLLRDYSNRPSWDSHCAEARLLRSSGANQDIVYLHHRLPWPVSDRDMIMTVDWSSSPQTRVVSMSARAVSGEMPPVNDRIRVDDAFERWTLTPLADGRTEIDAEIHLDPSGPLPGWLINQLLTESPLESFRKIRERLRKKVCPSRTATTSCCQLEADVRYDCK